MRVCPELVGKTLVCGWRCCKLVLIPMATFYVSFGRSVTVVRSTWEIHSPASTTDDGPRGSGECLWRPNISDSSGNNHFFCLILSKASGFGIFWTLVTEDSTCFAYFIRYSDSSAHSDNIGFFWWKGCFRCLLLDLPPSGIGWHEVSRTLSLCSCASRFCCSSGISEQCWIVYVLSEPNAHESTR